MHATQCAGSIANECKAPPTAILLRVIGSNTEILALCDWHRQVFVEAAQYSTLISATVELPGTLTLYGFEAERSFTVPGRG